MSKILSGTIWQDRLTLEGGTMISRTGDLRFTNDKSFMLRSYRSVSLLLFHIEMEVFAPRANNKEGYEGVPGDLKVTVGDAPAIFLAQRQKERL